MTTVVSPTSAAAARPLPYQVAVQALDVCRGAMVLCDVRTPGNPIVYANPAFLALTGYPLDEVIGRNCSFLHGTDTDSNVRAELRRAVSQGQGHTAVVRNYRSDGQAFWNRLSIAPIRDEQGELTHYVGMQEDVSEDLRKDVSLQMLLEAHGVAADAGRSFIMRRLGEALADHLVTGRHHALIEVRVHVAATGDELDALHHEGISATVGTHLRNLIPARASMSALSGLRFAVILPLIGSHEEAEMMATGLLAELPIPLESSSPSDSRHACPRASRCFRRTAPNAAALLAAVEGAAERGMAGASSRCSSSAPS